LFFRLNVSLLRENTVPKDKKETISKIYLKVKVINLQQSVEVKFLLGGKTSFVERKIKF